ncbi:MAG: T9SS type A sorting domain-containing protein, partial [Bacteroidia bacterium]|nr:T9SS type A sorting domain-containing protein [Bacteroidia bacterium]
ENGHGAQYLQAYPNPATEETMIYFDLPETYVNASIEIVNTLGSLIDVIKINEQRGSVELNSESLAKGLYFYHLRIGNEKFTGGKILIN